MKKLIKFITASALFMTIALVCGCKSENGFSPIGDGIYSKLNILGDCAPAMKDAEYFIIETSFHVPDKPELLGQAEPQTLYYHNVNNSTLQPWEDSIHWRIRNELNALNCGDGIVLRAPIHAVNKTFLCAYADCAQESANEVVEIRLNILKTFDEKGFRTYLQSAAQHGEMTESEAIELLLMNRPEHPYEKRGECFIETLSNGHGDTLAAGDEVTLSYTTYLLDGTSLDQPTEFQFTYGRPAQIVDGLHYALSLMHKGDESIIYLPSKLAFGSNGGGSGVVPPRTPVYFKLKLQNEPN